MISEGLVHHYDTETEAQQNSSHPGGHGAEKQGGLRARRTFQGDSPSDLLPQACLTHLLFTSSKIDTTLRTSQGISPFILGQGPCDLILS